MFTSLGCTARSAQCIQNNSEVTTSFCYKLVLVMHLFHQKYFQRNPTFPQALNNLSQMLLYSDLGLGRNSQEIHQHILDQAP